MSYLKINKDKVDPGTARQLMELCPFGAIEYGGGELTVSAACKMCKLCVKKGPAGVMEYIEEASPAVDKDAWRGVAVYAEQTGGVLHKVTLELLGKAKELAQVCGAPVYALLIGSEVGGIARELLHYGADKVFVYDYPELSGFKTDIYANAFYDFIQKIKPSAIMVGATNLGRTLAPRVAARCRTGLTADCTVLRMKENTDLVQIRPAFGGNIMAQIVTPRHRPQFCTVRYKVFSAPQRSDTAPGEIVPLELPAGSRASLIEILDVQEKPREVDISEAEIIVAAGRGVKTRDDLAMLEELAQLLGGVTASTRPLVECGWFDPKRQIGLSGRTVKAKLIITVGVSGSVQFAAGMKGSECIVAINSDPSASIFDIAHYGLVGDLYEILPRLIARVKEGKGLGI